MHFPFHLLSAATRADKYANTYEVYLKEKQCAKFNHLLRSWDSKTVTTAQYSLTLLHALLRHMNLKTD